MTFKDIEYLMNNGYIEKQIYFENQGFKFDQENKLMCAYKTGKFTSYKGGMEITSFNTAVVFFPDKINIVSSTTVISNNTNCCSTNFLKKVF